MRPLKLTMSAFGPYADKIELNLDTLGANGIYIITGDTGAGKTTIFDAIAYALYGEPSGENRSTSMLRSKYADIETPTEVELIFEYANQNYTIKRSPEYERPSMRGTGLTMKKTEAELILPNGDIVTKTKDVTAAVVNIIGVDRDQFSKIAMIAQGDFLKLLLAPTDERKKIFREIFNTKLYQNIQDLITREHIKLNNQRKKLNDSIIQYIQGVVCNSDDVLSIELDKAKSNSLPIDETVKLIETLLSQDQANQQNHKEDLDLIETQYKQVTTLLGRGEEIFKTRQSLVKANDDLNQKQKEIKDLFQKFEQQKQNQPLIKSLEEQITTDKNKMPLYDELEKQQNKLNKLKQEYVLRQASIDKNKDVINNDTKNIDELKSELEKIKDSDVAVEKLINEITNAQNKIKSLNLLNNSLSNLNNLKKNYLLVQEEYKTLSLKAQKAQLDYEKKNIAYLDGQAGVLASTLINGQPCPVCGSESHPQIAQIKKGAPTKQELDFAKTNSEKAQQISSIASNKASELLGKLKSEKGELEKLAQELLGKHELNQTYEKLNITINHENETLFELKSELKYQQNNLDRKNKISGEIPKKEVALKQVEAQLANDEKNLATSTGEIKALEKAIISLTKDLKFKNKNMALANISDLQGKKQLLEKEFEQAQSSYQNKMSEIDVLNGQITSYKAQLENADDIDIGLLTQQQAELILQKEQTNKSLTNIISRYKSNQAAYSGINKQQSDLTKLEARLSWMKSLSDTASGNIAGKEKITLETYIQMAYFDRIIDRANIRFMVMSNAQYELKRREDAKDKRTQSGLELDIIDHYNATTRSVNSLSGGESFMASLSLALGLSDEIQASAGGIKLDTMFIDEGFGTLDENTLQLAIKVLSSLSQGNKLIGIISHVAELREKIDNQIIVTKEKTGGSKVKIVT